MMADGHYYTLQIKDASSVERYSHLLSRCLARSRVVTVGAAQLLLISLCSSFSSFYWDSDLQTAFSLVKCLLQERFQQMCLTEAVKLQLKKQHLHR